ncbi:MAG: pyruvate kinase [Chitinophagales bacterium]|nr:pyruvate kinase [Chitinophagales bacterium]
MIRNHNRTKIIATTGPASNTYEILLEMVKAGVDVFRFNFSHGSYDDHKKLFDIVHQINNEFELNIGILADLQGPKIRLGVVKDNLVRLETGDIVRITNQKQESTAELLYISYPQLPQDAKPGDKILIDDGKVELEVLETDGDEFVTAKVTYGGAISSKKGVNLPDTKLSISSITEKDKEDLKFALDNQANWIALSFVRSAADIEELKQLINAHIENKHKVKIIAKIEKPEALENIDEIIEATDAIMVARGDLGVEVPMEKMPIIQKDLVRRAINASKPVVVATQIMESMIAMARPTRAEVNDVANDMIDGADALMLSGETAVGMHPVKVIETIVRIMNYVEEQEVVYNKNMPPEPSSKSFLSDAICYSASRLAEAIGAKAIIGMTRSGYTAFMVSSYRPHAKIIVFTDNKDLLKIMSISWGTHAYYYDKFISTDDTINDVIGFLKSEGVLQPGDVVVNTGSMPIHHQAKTNMLKVTVVD